MYIDEDFLRDQIKEINLELNYPPTLNKYYRIWNNQMLISSPGRTYRKHVERYVTDNNIDYDLDGNLEFIMYVYPPDRRRRDMDNLLKCVFDSIDKAGVIKDDSQITKLTVEKKDVIKDGKIMITIRNLKGEE